MNPSCPAAPAPRAKPQEPRAPLSLGSACQASSSSRTERHYANGRASFLCLRPPRSGAARLRALLLVLTEHPLIVGISPACLAKLGEGDLRLLWSFWSSAGARCLLLLSPPGEGLPPKACPERCSHNHQAESGPADTALPLTFTPAKYSAHKNHAKEEPSTCQHHKPPAM